MRGTKERDWRWAGSVLVSLCLEFAVVVGFPAAEAAPAAPLLSSETIVQNLVSANLRRAGAMRGYRSKRSYRVDYQGFLGSHSAEMQVEANYTAPNHKDFKILSESGAKLLINRVLLKLLESEKEALEDREQNELSPRNYQFTLLGTEHLPTGDVYVLAVRPRQNTKFLYAGKIWVDRSDFAVTRMEGEPAKNPSLWVSHVAIQYQWVKIGGFWVPVHNQSVTQVRMGGKALLTIDYTDYQISSTERAKGEPDPHKDSVLPDPASITPDEH
jgi:hypothetical protein